MKKIILNTMAQAAVIAVGQVTVLAQKVATTTKVEVLNSAANPVPVKAELGETFAAGAVASFGGSDLSKDATSRPCPLESGS